MSSGLNEQLRSLLKRWRLVVFCIVIAYWLVMLARYTKSTLNPPGVRIPELDMPRHFEHYEEPKDTDREALDDAMRFRQLFDWQNDLDLEVLTVEPTAKHTHSVLSLHSLGNYAPHAGHLHKWAVKHPGVKWYLPQSPSLPNPMNWSPFQGWYSPWVGEAANATDWNTVWHGVSHNFYNSSIGATETLSPEQSFGDPAAYSDKLFAEDEYGIALSVRRIWEIIKKQIHQEVPLENVIVIGFSQGGVLALALAGLLPRLPAGFLVYAGYTPFRTHPRRLSFNKDARIHFVHGMNDEIFRPPVVEYSLAILRDLGYSPTITWEDGLGHFFGPFDQQEAAFDRLVAEVWGDGA